MTNFFLFAYILAYLYGWKLFLDIKSFAFLKLYAVVWIISSFICFLVSKIKKQQPFLAFFVGSIFGPIGILMTLFSSKDIRVINENEIDKDFYAKIYQELEDLYLKIIPYPKRDGYKIVERLRFYGDFFKIKLQFPFSYSFGKVSPYYDPERLLNALKMVFDVFIKKYTLKFGEEHELARKKMQEIDVYLQRLKQGDPGLIKEFFPEKNKTAPKMRPSK